MAAPNTRKGKLTVSGREKIQNAALEKGGRTPVGEICERFPNVRPNVVGRVVHSTRRRHRRR